MDPTIVIAGVVFLMVASIAAVVALLFSGPQENVDARLRDLKTGGSSGRKSGDKADANAVRSVARDRLKDLGSMLAPGDEKERTKLQARLIQAGLYSQQALPVFIGAKTAALIILVGLGLGLTALGVVTPMIGLGITAVGGVVAFVLPGMWLDSLKKKRQTALRRALPDAMDVIVICMEGGLSLPASLARVADELGIAHPLLSQELRICQREIQMGKRTGESLKELSIRTDLEEVRSLAGVILQAEKYGASLAQALRIHSETMRQRRAQAAEEMAHQAGTKIMFPTLLFIFPGIFLVILGPAVVKILGTLGDINK